MHTYLVYVFTGFFAVFLYNYISNILRGMGNSTMPLIFLGVSVALNVGLDLLFVIPLGMGIMGAALATAIAQYVSGVGVLVYFIAAYPEFRLTRRDMRWDSRNFRSILSLSGFTCLQQSVMNLGILLVQGLINSFGTVIMAAFAAAVKIDSFAYMPVQDFGNAFSTFIAQNYGAGKAERIRKGMRSAALCAAGFCLLISLLVCLLARPLMGLFIDASRTDIIAAGVGYLRIEASFYIGIGLLFLFYGFYRAVGRPGISVVLTVISLGTRVALAYLLSALPAVGVTGIWVSVPIGWLLADLAGALYYIRHRKVLLGG